MELLNKKAYDSKSWTFDKKAYDSKSWTFDKKKQTAYDTNRGLLKKKHDRGLLIKKLRQ